MTSTATVIKAGYLMRKTKILRIWKRKWVTIDSTGWITYRDFPESNEPEGTYVMSNELPLKIRSANSYKDSPPSGYPSNALIGISGRFNNIDFCAESMDEAYTWYLTFWDVSQVLLRSINHGNPALTASTFGNSLANSHTVKVQTTDGNWHDVPVVYNANDATFRMPSRIILHPDGSRTILVTDNDITVSSVNCYCTRRYDCGCGYYPYLGLGVSGSLMATSLIMPPLMLWPFFFC